jgi:uncharacterized membrane protein YdcZ (DUF606 family)
MTHALMLAASVGSAAGAVFCLAAAISFAVSDEPKPLAALSFGVGTVVLVFLCVLAGNLATGAPL